MGVPGTQDRVDFAARWASYLFGALALTVGVLGVLSPRGFAADPVLTALEQAVVVLLLASGLLSLIARPHSRPAHLGLLAGAVTSAALAGFHLRALARTGLGHACGCLAVLGRARHEDMLLLSSALVLLNGIALAGQYRKAGDRRWIVAWGAVFLGASIGFALPPEVAHPRDSAANAVRESGVVEETARLRGKHSPLPSTPRAADAQSTTASLWTVDVIEDPVSSGRDSASRVSLWSSDGSLISDAPCAEGGVTTFSSTALPVGSPGPGAPAYASSVRGGRPVKAARVVWSSADSQSTGHGRAVLPADPTDGRLSGVVRDGTGSPIGGIDLVLSSEDDPHRLGTDSHRVRRVVLGGLSIATVTTDEGGLWVIEGWPAESAFVRVLSRGWCRLERDPLRPLDPRTPLSVRRGSGNELWLARKAVAGFRCVHASSPGVSPWISWPTVDRHDASNLPGWPAPSYRQENRVLPSGSRYVLYSRILPDHRHPLEQERAGIVRFWAPGYRDVERELGWVWSNGEEGLPVIELEPLAPGLPGGAHIDLRGLMHALPSMRVDVEISDSRQPERVLQRTVDLQEDAVVIPRVLRAGRYEIRSPLWGSSVPVDIHSSADTQVAVSAVELSGLRVTLPPDVDGGGAPRVLGFALLRGRVDRPYFTRTGVHAGVSPLASWRSRREALYLFQAQPARAEITITALDEDLGRWMGSTSLQRGRLSELTLAEAGDPHEARR